MKSRNATEFTGAAAPDAAEPLRLSSAPPQPDPGNGVGVADSTDPRYQVKRGDAASIFGGSPQARTERPAPPPPPPLAHEPLVHALRRLTVPDFEWPSAAPKKMRTAQAAFQMELAEVAAELGAVEAERAEIKAAPIRQMLNDPEGTRARLRDALRRAFAASDKVEPLAEKCIPWLREVAAWASDHMKALQKDTVEKHPQIPGSVQRAWEGAGFEGTVWAIAAGRHPDTAEFRVQLDRVNRLQDACRHAVRHAKVSKELEAYRANLEEAVKNLV